MSAMKKIIVPTDFSNYARQALKAAAAIAIRAGAEIHLVHVYEPASLRFAAADGNGTPDQSVYDRVEEEFNKLEQLTFMKGIKVIKHVFSDTKIHEALGRKEFAGAGLVVMGSHGASGWRTFFIGSNTELVVRHAAIPVLVVKEVLEVFEIKNMVFASDFFPENDETFVLIENLAKIFAAGIHLLKVITPGNFEPSYTSFELMKDFARRHQLTTFSVNVINDESVEAGVLNFSKNIRADIISMETHGRTGLAHLLNGSIAEKVVNLVLIPVLTVKIKYEFSESGFALPPKL